MSGSASSPRRLGPPQGNDLVQRVLTLPADLGALDRGKAMGPGFVQALEVEQAGGEALFEGGEGFGGAEAWG